MQRLLRLLTTGVAVSALLLGSATALPTFANAALSATARPYTNAQRYPFKEVGHYHGTTQMPEAAKYWNTNGTQVYRADLRQESYAFSFFYGSTSVPAAQAARERIKELYRGDRVDRITVVESEPRYAHLVAEGSLLARKRTFKTAVIVFEGHHYVLAYSAEPGKYRLFEREREYFLNSFGIYID
jgi:hypothetical protein